MADYVYGTRSTYAGGNGRLVARYTTTQNSRLPTDGNYWTQTDVAYDSRTPEVPHNHVCQPVVVDAYGRPIPGVVVLPADQHVANAGYVAESDYSIKTHPNYDHAARGPLDCDNGKCVPLAPTSYREQAPGPNRVNELIAGVQTDVSSGPRTGGFPPGMFQRRAAAAGTGRGRQVWGEEAPPPARQYEQSTISRPSRDVGTLAGYVREAARPKVGRQTAAPAVVETIDHNEAQRRYNNVPATGTMSVDPSLPTIDHKTAALKYSGALVN